MQLHTNWLPSFGRVRAGAGRDAAAAHRPTAGSAQQPAQRRHRAGVGCPAAAVAPDCSGAPRTSILPHLLSLVSGTVHASVYLVCRVTHASVPWYPELCSQMKA